MSEPETESARSRKFRQAAFVYLHVGLLYEFTVWVLWQEGLMPTGRGPIWIWLLAGAAIVALIFWALYSWQNRWVARAVWALHSLRLPALIEGAFFAQDDAFPPSFYLVATAVVLINLWMLARAGWDL